MRFRGMLAGGLAARSVNRLFKSAYLPRGSVRPSRLATPQFRDELSRIMWARNADATRFLRRVLPELAEDGEANIFARGPFQEPLRLRGKDDGERVPHVCTMRSYSLPLSSGVAPLENL